MLYSISAKQIKKYKVKTIILPTWIRRNEYKKFIICRLWAALHFQYEKQYEGPSVFSVDNRGFYYVYVNAIHYQGKKLLTLATKELLITVGHVDHLQYFLNTLPVLLLKPPDLKPIVSSRKREN